jgi:DNA-binding MarR family transcriptional regulator
LLNDAARQLRRDFLRRVQPDGLTPLQWRALAYVERNEGMSQAALAEMLEIQPISLARVIDRLEAAGWVERRRDSRDRRVQRLHLTDKAAPILAELHRHAEATLARALRGVTDQDRARAITVLGVIKRNLTDAS